MADEKLEKEFSPREEGIEWLETIALAAVAVVLIFTFVLRTATVSGTSMVPTLSNGDRLIISDLFYEPAQGDIVVVAPGVYEDHPLIKRVIATEGQTVDIDFDKGIVTVDGVALDEPYINEPTYLSEGMEFPATVPENCIFVMGDNRNNSKDSRDPSVGMVDVRYVVGRELLRIFPLSQFGPVD